MKKMVSVRIFERNMAYEEGFFTLFRKCKKIYERVKDLPVVDYHNHLSMDDIHENKRYSDICDLWVKPDPYKHRAMRMCGIHEYYITGKANNREKFSAWCKTLPKLLGNPLYHWAQMELEFFGIHKMPHEENAEALYNLCNAYLAENEVTPSFFAARLFQKDSMRFSRREI